MTTAVTGAAGYVGARLVGELRTQRSNVVPLVRSRRPWLGDDQRELDLISDADEALATALAGALTVVHLAGASEVIAAAEPERARHETVTATRRVALAAANAGVRRVVYLSTVHVYGARMTPGTVITEDLHCAPQAAYASARLESEIELAALAEAFDLVVLRLTNSVGAPAHPSVDRWTLVGNDLSRQAVVEHRMILRSSGLQYRDFVDLGDTCRIIAIAADPDGPVRPGTYNLGSGVPTTVWELAETVQGSVERETGTRPSIEAPPAEGAPPGPYTVDVRRLAACGIEAATPLRSSVDETVRFCLHHLEELTHA
jgi:UDP-glucose 4-epimerase